MLANQFPIEDETTPLAAGFEVACEFQADFTAFLAASPPLVIPTAPEPFREIKVCSLSVSSYALPAHQFLILREQFDIVLTLDTDRVTACMRWQENVGGSHLLHMTAAAD